VFHYGEGCVFFAQFEPSGRSWLLTPDEFDQSAKRKALSKADRKKYSPHITLSSTPSFLRS